MVRVLLVDDDAPLVELLKYALERHGYSVLGALDGEQALRRWEAERPDIVLLDADLPKPGGLEVCRRIRQGSGTAIIMLTARKEEADVVRGLDSGADDYVPKPFSVKQLAARMEAVLRRRPGPERRPSASRGSA
jgi:two-component system response regulator VicR